MTSLWLDGRSAITTDAFEVGAHYDAVVVGAGFTGLTTALLLVRSGMSVAVLEARQIGAVTSGNTTAKLSLLQGNVLSGIRRHFSQKVVDAYVEGNRQGQAWMLRYLSDNDVPVQHRDAYTYAGTPDGTTAIDNEFAVAHAAGLDVVRTDETELPYRTHGALRLADQTQFNPMDVLDALANDLCSLGGKIIQGARVRDVETGEPTTVLTERGNITAGLVVLATGTPILDRGLYFAKLIPSRSHAAAYRVPGAPESVPAGMYLSIDAPTRSLRTADVAGQTLLLIGGNGHIVGRRPSTRADAQDLDVWTAHHFPGAERTHRWSAQDYQSANMVPFVGWFPRGRGRIYLATGYNKWGMTNSVAAALSLAADILGDNLPWAKTLRRRVTGPADIATGAKFNASVAGMDVKGWLHAEISPPAPPAEGQGVISHDGLHPVATSMVDGVRCSLSAVCTHLGGIVTWNDAERTWDCPLHGSRFAADGTILEGPATTNLTRHDARS